MEGISNEAASLAGHWGLGKLICLYDDNHISIDGDTEIAFTENVGKRFDALGWHTIWVQNGNNDYDAIRAAIEEAKSVTDKPTMIKVKPTAILMVASFIAKLFLASASLVILVNVHHMSSLLWYMLMHWIDKFQVTTTIGYGSPNKANSYSVHGSALGTKEVDATRANLGWDHEPFFVPEEVKRYTLIMLLIPLLARIGILITVLK